LNIIIEIFFLRIADLKAVMMMMMMIDECQIIIVIFTNQFLEKITLFENLLQKIIVN
jgi:hypothetical protein